MNLDKFSIAVLQSVVNSLIGFLSLCVLYMSNFFPVELRRLLYNCVMPLLYPPCFSIYQPILEHF